MKQMVLIWLVSAFALWAQAELGAQAPKFEDEEFITANGTPITLSLGHAAPWVGDWDGDGIKDLFVGQYTSGKIRFYKNMGTNSAPEFTTYTYLQADGMDIVLPYG